MRNAVSRTTDNGIISQPGVLQILVLVVLRVLAAGNSIRLGWDQKLRIASNLRSMESMGSFNDCGLAPCQCQNGSAFLFKNLFGLSWTAMGFIMTRNLFLEFRRGGGIDSAIRSSAIGIFQDSLNGMSGERVDRVVQAIQSTVRTVRSASFVWNRSSMRLCVNVRGGRGDAWILLAPSIRRVWLVGVGGRERLYVYGTGIPALGVGGVGKGGELRSREGNHL